MKTYHIGWLVCLTAMKWAQVRPAWREPCQSLHPQVVCVGVVIPLGCVLGIWCREQRADVRHALVDFILIHFDRALPYTQVVSERLRFIELQTILGHQLPGLRHIAGAARQLKVINID